METRVSLVIKSHLNDAMDEVHNNSKLVQERLRFVKYLVHMFPDTDENIDVDVIYKLFKLGDV